MKTLLIALIFGLGFASSTVAQTNASQQGHAAITFSANTPVEETLVWLVGQRQIDALIFDQDASVEGVVLGREVRIEGTDKNLEAVRKLLPPDFEAYFDNSGRVHIRKNFPLPPAPYQENRLPNLPPPANVVPLMQTTPNSILDFIPPPSFIVVPYSSQYIYGQAGYFGGYGLMWQGCLTGPSGYIKFKYKGRSHERHLWYVYINGEVVGSIDQGDSFFNRVDVCAASTLITIEKLGQGKWENRYSIRPGTLTEIGVGDFLPLTGPRQ